MCGFFFFKDLITSERQIPVANICSITVFYYSLFSLERGLQTTPWFHVSVPQRACIQGRATWSLQLELCYVNTIRCTEVISSPYGLNVQLWEVILESLKSWSKSPYCAQFFVYVWCVGFVFLKQLLFPHPGLIMEVLSQWLCLLYYSV